MPTYSASEKLNWLIGFTRIGLFSITYILTGSLDLFRGSLKHWIAAVAPELVEGLHYSIMFYGGRLLSHLSAGICQTRCPIFHAANFNFPAVSPSTFAGFNQTSLT
ncbi:hypothetical protein CHR62_15615 [Pusillimonas sp. NJUB218]|nr:hypothetical protein CHR62_15615 [Pusillimonas sp. NJUB218]